MCTHENFFKNSAVEILVILKRNKLMLIFGKNFRVDD